MLFVNVTPSRAAPPLQVDVLTAEKNSSPAFSDDERSPQPPTSTTAAESTSPSTGKASLALKSHTNFARTYLAAVAQTTPPSAQNSGLCAAAPQHAVQNGEVPTRAAPSPVRSILDFYLGASPSPRRPAENDVLHSSQPVSPGTRSNIAEAHSNTPLCARLPSSSSSPTSTSPAASSKPFRRSPAPAHTYLDEFLAAEDDTDTYVDACEGRCGHEARPTPLFVERSPGIPRRGGRRMVGVALDNSPLVPEMWEETSSSSSTPVSSEPTSPMASAEDAHREGLVLETNDSLQRKEGNLTDAQRDAEAREQPLHHAMRNEKRAHSLSTLSTVAPWPVANHPPTPKTKSPTVERELFVSKQPACEEEQPTSSSQPQTLFLGAFASGKDSGVSHGIENDAASPSSLPQPLSAPPPRPTAMRAQAAPPAGPIEHTAMPSAPSQTFTALSALLQLQRDRVGTRTKFASSPPSPKALRLEPPWWAWHAKAATTDSVQPVVSGPHQTPAHISTFNGSGEQRSSSNGCGEETQRTLPLDSMMQPASVPFDSSCTTMPTSAVRRPRSVVARLYPLPPSAATKRSEHADATVDIRAPRWNASTKIRYNPLSESLEPPEAHESQLRQRDHSASRGPANGVGKRSRIWSRLRSASAPHVSTPPAPPLHTRTSLLRLQNMSARKAEEAARLEEELHPSFRPELAPNSARICRNKLRELTAVEADARANEGENALRVSDAEATKVATSAEAQTARDKPNEKRVKRCNDSGRLARQRSVERRAPSKEENSVLCRRRPPSARSASKVGERLFAEAAERKARQVQRRLKHENEVQAQERATRQVRLGASQLPSTLSAHHRHAAATPVKNADEEVLKSDAAAAERSRIKGTSVDVARSASHVFPLSSSSSGAVGAALARVDLYSGTDMCTRAGGVTGMPVQQQHESVEARLLALEEDRRRRLFLMRRYADTHDAATGHKLFKPFTGR
ncbi:hypothetical protein N2W54_007032 [Lotmaria passim]